MKVMVTTALFDIKRQTKGDGRSINEYLRWFEKTLKLKCDMTIYTEQRFKSFVELHRNKLSNKTNIIIQKLENIPFYSNREKMLNIMRSHEYKTKIKSPNRIECFLPEYNLIQYSKFGWLKQTAEANLDHDFFFWMDAGCSRFFLDCDLEKEWPNVNSFDSQKFIIQRNTNFPNMWDGLNIDEYIWDSECMLVGTLFGGNRKTISKIKQQIEDITENIFFKNHCINNEQFALAIAFKLNKELFDVRQQRLGLELEGSSHLPLFKCLSKNYEVISNEK